MHGVKGWLEILKFHIPDHEILNYCVSLYYNRSMVTLASLIIDAFRDLAYCPGRKNQSFDFLDNLSVINQNGKTARQFIEIKGNKTIAFVSDDLPVSMVETISKMRQLAEQKKDMAVIVAPLQQLSDKHLAMNKMVSNGNMYFINDKKWRKENLATKIQLPLFQRIGDTVD